MTTPHFHRWSYSAWDNFRTCPKKYWAEKIAKVVPYEVGETQQWGIDVHEALEHRLRDRNLLAERYKSFETVAQWAESFPGDERLYEHKLAVSRQYYAPCEANSKDAWCVGIMDVLILDRKNKTAYVIDWKLGKKKTNSQQMALYAALIFAHYGEEIHNVKAVYAWLKTAEKTHERYDINEKYTLWDSFMPGVNRMEKAYQTGNFMAQSSGLCRAWCGYFACTFNGRKNP